MLSALQLFRGRRKLTLALLAAIQLSAAACVSEDPNSAAQAPTPQPVQSASTHDGDGHSLRKTIARELSRSPADLRKVARADGLEEVEIVSGFRHAVMLVKTQDGGLTQTCVHDAPEALRLLDHGAP